MDMDLDSLGTPAETIRRAYALRWTYRTADRASYDIGTRCQQAGVPYRGAVTPAERAAVDAATLSERCGDTLVIMRADPLPDYNDDWPYIGANEIYTDVAAQIAAAELIAALICGLLLAIVGLCVAPGLIILGLRATLQQRARHDAD